MAREPSNRTKDDISFHPSSVLKKKEIALGAQTVSRRNRLGPRSPLSAHSKTANAQDGTNSAKLCRPQLTYR